MPHVQTTLIVDQARNHFILLDIGWHESEYIHEWVYHFEFKDGKLIVHEDATDSQIVQVLIDKGIDRQDIIMAFWEQIEEVTDDVVAA